MTTEDYVYLGIGTAILLFVAVHWLVIGRKPL